MEKVLAGANIFYASCNWYYVEYFFFFYFKYTIEGSYELPVKIENVENVDYKNLNFLSSYIIPLVSIDKPLIASILLITLAIMHIKANLFYKNPILAIFGYHLYNIKTKTSSNIIAISKEKLIINDYIKYINLGNSIYYVKKIS